MKTDICPTLIVFSHLRWNFVFQRPQHLMTRFSRRQPVWFVEEPVHQPGAEPHWEAEHVSSSLTVWRFHSPLPSVGFADDQLELMRPHLETLIQREGIDAYVLWFYSPMALPLTDGLQPQAVVYDCMDELTAFLNAPPELKARETQLLTQANVVFTGGPSLYRAKRDKHANVHCFSSSVDVAHFASAEVPADPEDQQGIPFPRLGYVGVIDERFDLGLLDAVSRARPDWQLVMVGPVVKIDPATLPQRANIHYLGGRQYADLPAYLSGWDVCLMPFARNASTKHISPTKVLEYMAADRAIVSTSIADVADIYSEIVYLGDTPGEFLAACDRALHDPQKESESRRQKAMAVLASTSWEKTVSAMADLIDQAVRLRDVHEDLPSGTPAASSTGASAVPVVIIGAGPTGLSASHHLGEDSVVLEQNDHVGGWCRSVVANGFTFDYAGHIMFSNDPYVHELYEQLLGDNVHWQHREAWVYSKNVHTRYPFQGSLYGLPADVIKECLLGAVEAHHGPMASAPPKKPTTSSSANGSNNGAATNGTPYKRNNAIGCNGSGAKASEQRLNPIRRPLNTCEDKELLSDCCADGILESTAALVEGMGARTLQSSNGKPPPTSNGHADHNGHSDDSVDAPRPSDGSPANFEEFIYKVWGSGIAKHFAIPYNRKLWAVPLDEMETSWLGGRVPMPDLGEMIEGALKPSTTPMGPNARFGYPLRGGFQALMDAFVPILKGELRTNTRVTAVDPEAHRVTLNDGTSIEYDHLISTMPLPVLVRSLGDSVPEKVREAATKLRYVSVRCVHIGVGLENLTEKHWIYYPEDTVFHRVFVQGNASPHCNPPGGFGLTCEMTYSPHKPLPCDGEALSQRCIDECIRVGMIPDGAPIWTTLQCDLPYAYVVYDHARATLVSIIRTWLDQHDILLAGRYSEWEYYNSDHAFLAGKKVADTVRQRQNARYTTMKEERHASLIAD